MGGITNKTVHLSFAVDWSKEVNPLLWFIRNTLTKAILLPITADSQDTALTIFSTLNDRGLALSDADIFKAKIYNHLDEKGKKEFIEILVLAL